MKYKVKYVALLASFFIRIGVGYAQDWKKDLRELNKTYLQAKSFSMDVVVESYKNVADLTPIATYAGYVAKSENSYFTSMIGKTTITNPHCVLLVDQQQKVVLYKENKSKKTKPADFFTMTELDSAILLMTKDADVSYLTNSSTEKCIRMKDKITGNNKLEITIDPAANTLVKIIYYTQKVEKDKKVIIKQVVKYNNVKINGSISDDIFSEKKYIKKSINGISLTKDYSRYELVNESELTPQ